MNRARTLGAADEALAHIEKNIDSASESEKRLARGYRLTRVHTTFSTPRYAPGGVGDKLGLLVEECGEVLAAVGKTYRFGLSSSNPTLHVDDRETNQEWILRELRDLKRAIEIVEQELDSGERAWKV